MNCCVSDNFSQSSGDSSSDVLKNKIAKCGQILGEMGWMCTLTAFTQVIEQRAKDNEWDQDTKNLILIDALNNYIEVKKARPVWTEADLFVELTINKNRATKDHLTGIRNRLEFDEALHGQTLYPCSLIICDLNGFKAINDQLGHQAGDDALKHFVNVAKEATRGNDGFYRTGGDEFAFILPGKDNFVAQQVIARIRTALDENPFIWQRQEIILRTSAGIASVQRDKPTLQSYEEADANMYEDKKAQPKAIIPLNGSGIPSGAVLAPQML